MSCEEPRTTFLQSNKSIFGAVKNRPNLTDCILRVIQSSCEASSTLVTTYIQVNYNGLPTFYLRIFTVQEK